MISFLHSKLRHLFTLVLIVATAAFFLIDVKLPSQNEILGELRGRSISQNEFRGQHQATQIMFTLQTGQFANRMRNMENFFFRQTLNRMLVLALAKEEGITTSDSEIANFITSSAIFQKDGKFSEESYQNFTANFLKPQGISQKRFESIIRDQLIHDSFTEAIGDAITVSPQEINAKISQQYGNVSAVKFSLHQKSLLKNLKVSDTEIKEFYRQNTSRYLAPESRSFEYAFFPFPDNFSSLKPEEQNQLKKTLGEKAYQFADLFLTEDKPLDPKSAFADQAKQTGATLLTSEAVAKNQPISDTFPELAITSIGFNLTPEAPVSEEILTDKGFIILHLGETLSPRPLAFEKVKTSAKTALLDQKRKTLLNEKALATQSSILALIKEGEKTSSIAKKTKTKLTKLPAFSPANTSTLKDPDSALIRSSIAQMESGELSSYIPSSEGGFFLYLEKRDAPPEDKMSIMVPIMKQGLLQQKRASAVTQWTQAQLEAPGNTLYQTLMGNNRP